MPFCPFAMATRRQSGLMSALNACCSLAVLVCILGTVQAFYFPGVAPNEFEDGEKLFIKAVKLTSVRTQLPYRFYDLPYCDPKPENAKHAPENLGEILRGDRIVNTPYVVNVLQRVECAVVCDKTEFSEQETNQFVDKILDDYTAHMLLDNLPAATVFTNLDTNEDQYEDGFKVGFIVDDQIYLNNHLHFVVDYHSVPGEDGKGEVHRIVGFQVVARSISMESQKWNKAQGSCEAPPPNDASVTALKRGEKSSVLFTYSVSWKKSEVAWASRWDTYLRMSDVEVHWFAICNSVAIVLFLSGILALILVRTLRRDIARYNKLSDDAEFDDTFEETGWKLVHGDVFRPPPHPMLLSAFLGSGIQIFSMVLIILVFAMFGMLSPASRGALMTAAIVLFMFMGLVAGYNGARMYRTLKGIHWKRAAVLTATLYPGVVFGFGFVLNFFIWGKHSSGAVPFTTMLALLTMWFGISFPLVFVGFYFGFRKQPYEHPVRTNQIPRQIPDQVWYLTPVASSLLAGILPFGAVFVELFFILSAIWENQFYYLFGFLFLVFVILIIACSEVAIVMVYFQLCGENYHWWWKSFFLSGSCAYYVLGYSVVYYMTKLEIEHFIPTLLYFGYTSIMVFGFWLLTGSIGFYSTYFFIRKIYSAVKQD